MKVFSINRKRKILLFEQLWQKRAYTRGYFLNAMSFLPNDLTGYVSTPQSTATDELINASNAAAESMNTGALECIQRTRC